MKITPVTWTSRTGVSCRTANANTAPSTRRKMPGPIALLLSTALPTYQRHRILTPHDGHIAGRSRVDEDVTAPPVLRLAVLGDSIGYGTGAQRAEDALGWRLAAALIEAGHPAEPRVLA